MMAYAENDMKDQDNGQSVVDETHDLWKTYSQERDRWARNAKEDKEFRLGRQWTKDQEEVLLNRGQAPIVVNRIHPAVESAKALLTSNRPSFRCAAREDSDNKVAQVMSALLRYMYDISAGRTLISQLVDEFDGCGGGYALVYQDPIKDMGKGEVCFHDIDPLDVYVDPNSRDRFFDDAENIIVSRMFTKDQAKKLYPMYGEKIENASGKWDKDWDAPVTNRADSSQHVIFPEDIKEIQEQEYVTGY